MKSYFVALFVALWSAATHAQIFNIDNNNGGSTATTTNVGGVSTTANHFVWMVPSGTAYNTSSDGRTWAAHTGGVSCLGWAPSNTHRLPAFVWTGSQIVGACAQSSAVYAVSSDGNTWTTGNSQVIAFGIAWSGSSYLITSCSNCTNGNATPDTATSTDGITWVKHASALPNGNYGSVAWTGSQWLAIRGFGTGTDAAYSSDGITWTTSALPSSSPWINVVCSPSVCVATSTCNGSAVCSTAYTLNGGQTWTSGSVTGQINSGNKVAWNGLTGTDQRFIIYGVASGIGFAQRSSDGINWTGAATPPGATSTDYVAHWMGRQWGLVTVGTFDGNHLITSPTGDVWTNQIQIPSAISTVTFPGIVWAGGLISNSTTLNDCTWASPCPIGTSTPNTGSFTTYSTATNCTSSAAPAVCGAAAAGSVVIAAAATTVVVNTTAVTANSQIFIQHDDALGTKLSVTCNATINTLRVSARTAATSFTITAGAGPVTNPECISYYIVN